MGGGCFLLLKRLVFIFVLSGRPAYFSLLGLGSARAQKAKQIQTVKEAPFTEITAALYIMSYPLCLKSACAIYRNIFSAGEKRLA